MPVLFGRDRTGRTRGLLPTGKPTVNRAASKSRRCSPRGPRSRLSATDCRGRTGPCTAKDFSPFHPAIAEDRETDVSIVRLAPSNQSFSYDLIIADQVAVRIGAISLNPLPDAPVSTFRSHSVKRIIRAISKSTSRKKNRTMRLAICAISTHPNSL